MEPIPVKSSAIGKIGYDDGNLFIKFLENGWYIFRNCPVNLFEEFRATASKGKFFNRHVKPYFHGEPCPSPEQ